MDRQPTSGSPHSRHSRDLAFPSDLLPVKRFPLRVTRFGSKGWTCLPLQISAMVATFAMFTISRSNFAAPACPAADARRMDVADSVLEGPPERVSLQSLDQSTHESTLGDFRAHDLWKV